MNAIALQLVVGSLITMTPLLDAALLVVIVRGAVGLVRDLRQIAHDWRHRPKD